MGSSAIKNYFALKKMRMKHSPRKRTIEPSPTNPKQKKASSPPQKQTTSMKPSAENVRSPRKRTRSNKEHEEHMDEQRPTKRTTRPATQDARKSQKKKIKTPIEVQEEGKEEDKGREDEEQDDMEEQQQKKINKQTTNATHSKSSVDCGLFVCFIIKRLAEKREIPQTIQPRDIAEFRVHMVCKFLNDDQRTWTEDLWKDNQLANKMEQ